MTTNIHGVPTMQYYLTISITYFIILSSFSSASTNQTADHSCLDDGSVTATHQDIHFSFLHNQTHDFVRYRVQTNITFRLTPTQLTRNGGIFRFQLHGRCPSWEPILRNDSYLLITSSPETVRRTGRVEISCCSTERDTMIVKIALNSTNVLDHLFTLVLPSLEEKTETDLVGVTRVPLASTGALLSRQHPNGTGGAMVMTNFHDIFVRHAFPLIDSLTALYTIQLSITVDESQRVPHQNEDLIVLANTPLRKSWTFGANSNKRPGKTWVFDPSPRMPGSYLAFIIGKFRRNAGKTKRGTEINIWTLPNSLGNVNHAESTRFALDMTAILLEYYEDEFDFSYPLSKMDIVEAPMDYEAFIVWGICFVKPGRLHIVKGALQASGSAPGGFLGGPPASTRDTIPKKKEITEIMAHEISHQWFGCLVSPRTWNDVFLSESFATFYGVEAIRFAKGVPQWMASEAMITALTHRKISLHTDPTIPISSPIMYKNWSRDVQFSTIVYHKGATLLRMLKWVIGDKTFRDGVRRYLRRYQYSNAGANEFLDIFNETVRDHKIPGWDNRVLDAKAFLTPYLYQPSYPVVNVRVNRTHATLQQEPFQREQQSQKQQILAKSYQWYVPITVHLQSKHMKNYWLKPNDTLCLPVSDFGFMIRLFHLYVVRPISTGPLEGEDGDEGEDMDDDHVNILD